MSTTALRALVAWPVVAAEAILLGTSIFVLFVSAPTDRRAEQLIFLPLWRWLALIALAALPLMLLVDTASMADTRLLKALVLIPEVARATHFGRTWICDFIFVCAIVAIVLIAVHSRLLPVLVALLSGAGLFTCALASHAIDRGAVAVGVYFIHETAASMWIGAILGLRLGVLHGRLESEWVRRTGPRVSRLAEWTVMVLILSGLYTAWHELEGDPRRLLDAAYGRTLIVKIAVAAVVLAIGGYNRFFLITTLENSASRTALLRNVEIESLMLIGVLGIAALLANTPPPH